MHLDIQFFFAVALVAWTVPGMASASDLALRAGPAEIEAASGGRIDRISVVAMAGAGAVAVPLYWVLGWRLDR